MDVSFFQRKEEEKSSYIRRTRIAISTAHQRLHKTYGDYLRVIRRLRRYEALDASTVAQYMRAGSVGLADRTTDRIGSIGLEKFWATADDRHEFPEAPPARIC